MGGKGSSAPAPVQSPPVQYIPPTFTPMTVPTYTPVTPYQPPRIPDIPVYQPPPPLPVNPLLGTHTVGDKQVSNDPLTAYNDAKTEQNIEKQQQTGKEMTAKAKRLADAPLTYTREEAGSIKGASLLG